MKNAVLSLLFFTGTVFTLTSAGLNSSTLDPASCIYECAQEADEQFENDFHLKDMSWEDAHEE